jgi:hypothetical protein
MDTDGKTYWTFIRSCRDWQSFARARKIVVDKGLTYDEAKRACDAYNSNLTARQRRHGTKMEFTAEACREKTTTMSTTNDHPSFIRQFLGEETREAVVTVNVTGTPATVQKAIKQLAKKPVKKPAGSSPALKAKKDEPEADPDRTPAKDVVESLLTEVAAKGEPDEVRASFGPGTYFIGDICYALDDKLYHDVWGGEHDYDDGVFEAGGKKFVVARTKYGDGGYPGTDGREYGVDAGVIGIVPQELWKKDAKAEPPGGRVVKVTDSLTFAASDGIFDISIDGEELRINTRDDEDEEVEDDLDLADDENDEDV